MKSFFFISCKPNHKVLRTIYRDKTEYFLLFSLFSPNRTLNLNIFKYLFSKKIGFQHKFVHCLECGETYISISGLVEHVGHRIFQFPPPDSRLKIWKTKWRHFRQNTQAPFYRRIFFLWLHSTQKNVKLLRKIKLIYS